MRGIPSHKKVRTDREDYVKAMEQFLFLERRVFRREPPLSAAQEAVEYYVDGFVRYKDYLEIAGWAFIRGKSSENSRVSVILKSDKSWYVFLTKPVRRPDVTGHFKTLNYDDSGFFLQIPYAVLESDTYEIGVSVEKDNKEALTFTGNYFVLEAWQDISLPEVGIAGLLPEDTPIKIVEQSGTDGNISDYELEVISKLMVFYRPSKVFEIGTFDGRTALNMACNTPQEAAVYTLDLPRNRKRFVELSLDPREEKYIDKEMSGIRYRGTPYEKKIIQLYGDSAAFDFSPYYGKMNFVFIDGSHAYEYVLNDTEKSLRLLSRENGILLWHDYGVWEGVTKALNELYLSDCRFKNLRKIGGTSLAFWRN